MTEKEWEAALQLLFVKSHAVRRNDKIFPENVFILLPFQDTPLFDSGTTLINCSLGLKLLPLQSGVWLGITHSPVFPMLMLEGFLFISLAINSAVTTCGDWTLGLLSSSLGLKWQLCRSEPLLFLQRNQVQSTDHPIAHNCNSRFRGSDAVFWPPRVCGAYYIKESLFKINFFFLVVVNDISQGITLSHSH